MENRIPSIQDISKIEPAPNRLYFFDANVWLMVLMPSTSRQKIKQEEPYREFWNKVMALYQTGTRVVVNPVLLSEIHNRFLRAGFDKYRDDKWKSGELTREQAQSLTFKDDYRPSSECKQRANDFAYEMSGYSLFLKYLGDAELVETTMTEMLTKAKPQSDFNDEYFLRFCQYHNIPLVTHDGDFYEPGPEIYTANEQMLTWMALVSKPKKNKK